LNAKSLPKPIEACGSPLTYKPIWSVMRQLSAVSSLPDFQRVMILAAHRTGKLLNKPTLPATRRSVTRRRTGT
jgi:hypothetical protein